MRRKSGGIVRAVVVAVALVAAPVLTVGAPPAASSPSTWTIAPSESPFEASRTPLTGVSCSSPTSCFAVGIKQPFDNTFPGDTIERWNGTTWSVVPSPDPAGTTLNAVSCASATSCFAVGNSSSETSIQKWDGTSWSVVPSPTPTGASFVALYGVSCASAMDCHAVGGYSTASRFEGSLVEHWNGTAWSIVPSPSDQGGGLLFAVSCPTSTSCFAVGATAVGPLVEEWDGTGWSIVPSPAPPSADGMDMIELKAVSCASANDCQAVGDGFQSYVMNDAGDTGPTRSIAEHWDGSTWSIVARPPEVPITLEGVSPLGDLTGISCPSPTSCAAVGNSLLVERWDGASWSIAPLDAHTSYSSLNNVSCRSATSCIAVGSAYSFDRLHTLVERWDGASWTVVPTPEPRGVEVDAELNAVSCASPTNCTAVGDFSRRTYYSGSASTQLIEHWDGMRWSISANTSSAQANTGRLDGVSCPSPTSCNAVGQYETVVAGELITKPLTEHWDGKRWSIAPNPKQTGGALTAVSCWGVTTCYAVGQTDAGTATTERWNGKSWSIVPTPNPKGVTISLSGISCPSPMSCTAVGTSTTTLGNISAVVERWNGKSWSIVAVPRPSGAGGALARVSCHAVNSCTAVGHSDDTPGSDFYPYEGAHLVVEQWNGATWSIAPVQTPADATGAALFGAACPTDSACVGVGSYLLDVAHSPGLYTLAERSG